MISEKVKQSLRDSYAKKATERDQTQVEAWKQREREKFLHSLLDNKLSTLLEIGSGPGREGIYFQEQGLQVVCTDLSPEMVNLCKEKGLEAHTMGFDDLTFSDQSFDAVWAMNCLLHVPKQEFESVIEGIRRVLKKNGLFYLGVYGGKDSEGMWEDDFYEPKRYFSFYHHEDIQQLVEKYFDIVSFDILRPEEIGQKELSFQSFILKRVE
ncbi:class I SAM-dependent methyltransferase [Bacillus timonensis]|nr:class I SAM-dependent methyltransferase [Bacillus timonensis]